MRHPCRFARFCPFWVLITGCMLAGLLLAACGSSESASSLAPPVDTPAATRRPFTLPPTWTPTWTPTPIPPTATPLPSNTPGSTPMPSDADRCAAFVMISHPADGAPIAINKFRAVTFIWNYPVVAGASLLAVVRAGSEGGEALLVPGPDTVVATIPLRALAGPGAYRWTVAPIGADGQPIQACAASGRFALVLRPREENRYPIP